MFIMHTPFITDDNDRLALKKYNGQHADRFYYPTIKTLKSSLGELYDIVVL